MHPSDQVCRPATIHVSYEDVSYEDDNIEFTPVAAPLVKLMGV